MIRFKHILTAAACAVVFMLTASAQNPITIAVSSTPAAIVTTQPANYMKVRENSASPACGFTIILPGSTTALTYAAGTEFQFVAGPNAPWPSGTTIGTITSTGGSCSFVGVQSVGTVPSGQSAKPASSSGSCGTLTANQILYGTGLATCATSGSLTWNGSTLAVTGGLSATGPVTFTDCVQRAGVLCIDAANSQGWSGSTIAAWIASAQASSGCTNGCTIDARGTNGASLNFATEIDVGNSSAKPVRLLLPEYGFWTDNDTTTTDFGIRVYDESSVVGQGVGYGQGFWIFASGTSSIASLCGNDPTVGYYVTIEGFACQAQAGATLTGAALDINGADDTTYVGHMTAQSLSVNAHKGLWVRESCCSATIDNIGASSNHIAGVVPCTFGDSTANNKSVHFKDLSCTGPGPSENNVVIVETSSENTGSNTYTNIYTEVNTSDSDTSTAVLGITGASGQVEHIDGFRLGNDTTPSTRYLVSIANGASAILDNMTLGSVSVNGISDSNAGRGNISPGAGATIPHYEVLSSVSTGIGYTGPRITFGTLDGQAPLTITTAATGNLGATFSSGYTLNQEATAGTGVTYTLPATVVGKQYCVANSGTTGVVNTGVLTVYPPSSSFVILNGVVNTVGGGGTHGVASGGAAGDAACFVAIDATHWQVYVGKGTWTEN